jgi:hypothetical protein
LVGPPAVVGSGVSRQEARTIDAFHEVEAGNSLLVNITVDPGAKPSLKISGDDNLVPLVESVIRDGTLVLRVKEGTSMKPKLPIVAEVIAGELEGVDASGAARITVKGVVKTKRFAAEASGAAQVVVEGLALSEAIADASGASQIELSGSAASLKVEASGAGQVKARALQVDDANVSIDGASVVVVRVSNSVAGELSGASQLDVSGNPAKKSVSTSGASRVVFNP